MTAARSPVGGALTLNLDIDGFFLGPEFAAILASLFTALFGGFANALIGSAFGSGVVKSPRACSTACSTNRRARS